MSPFFGMNLENFRLFLAYCESTGAKIFENTPDAFQLVQALATDHPNEVTVSYCEDDRSGADVLVQIVGPCPALNDGSCDLIGQKARPTGCEWSNRISALKRGAFAPTS
jgi:hypothetical protein